MNRASPSRAEIVENGCGAPPSAASSAATTSQHIRTSSPGVRAHSFAASSANPGGWMGSTYSLPARSALPAAPAARSPSAKRWGKPGCAWRASPSRADW